MRRDVPRRTPLPRHRGPCTRRFPNQTPPCFLGLALAVVSSFHLRPKPGKPGDDKTTGKPGDGKPGTDGVVPTRQENQKARGAAQSPSLPFGHRENGSRAKGSGIEAARSRFPPYWVVGRMSEISPFCNCSGSFGGLKSFVLRIRHGSPGGETASTRATVNRGPWKYSTLIS